MSGQPVQLTQRRCFIHQRREAAARCPECNRYFCRECVTEHDERVLCAGCIKRLQPRRRFDRRRLGSLVRGFQLTSGIVVLWLVFYYLGQLLLTLPSAFHEGTLWRDLW